MTPWIESAWVAAAGATLVHFIWQGTAIAALAALLFRLLRAAAPQTRYAAGCLMLMAMIVAPVATFRLVASASSMTSAGARSATMPVRATAAEVRRSAAAPHVVAAAAPLAAVREAIAGSGASPSMRTRAVVVLAWLTGVALLLIRLAYGSWRVRGLRRTTTAAPVSRFEARAVAIARQLGVTQVLRIVDSDAVETPVLVGVLRPLIVLPIATLASLSPAQVDAILAHEIAHVRRHDVLVSMLQALVETLLFYHPGVWWLSSRIRIEREHCCDDVAVTVCGDAVVYAEALTELASMSLRVAPVGVSVASGSLVSRIRRLVGERAPSSRPTGALAIATLVLLVASGAGLVVTAQPIVDPASPAGRTAQERSAPDAINRWLGFRLVPGRPEYPTSDPLDAPAWDITIHHRDGEMKLAGFTGRSAIRYAYDLGEMPVLDGPPWIDESMTLSIEVDGPAPAEAEARAALRDGLERQFEIVVRRDSREFPAYALTIADGPLASTAIRPSTSSCYDEQALQRAIARHEPLRGGQRAVFCGIDGRFDGFTARKVTMAEYARAMYGFFDRPVVDRTDLDGRYDFSLQTGPLPLVGILSIHPGLAPVFAPLGAIPFDRAVAEQLGLHFEPTEAPQEIAIIEAASLPPAVTQLASGSAPSGGSMR